ncbi:MAG: hypothetical protein J6T47_01340, partial [Lachnospiraceae bacterium]|nr:hypothetical protein [Lachnospiraceae bacterium]
HWPVVLVLGVIYLVWIYLQITSKDTSSNSIRSLLDVLIRAYSDYYGFSWSGFEANKIVSYANQTTGNEYLFALLLIHLPFTVLLGYNMLRKFRLSSVALALLFPCFLIFMNGYTPDRHAFIRVLLLFAVLAVLGIQMKIEEKQQTVRSRNGSGSAGVFCIHPPKAVFPLFIMGLATVLAGMVFPMFAEEKMTELVRPAQEFMYSGGPERLLKELRGRLFGTNSGGISGGDLASTGSIQPDKDHVLLKVRRSDGNNSRYSYLKCYVGEVYTGKRWADLPDIIRSQYRKSLTYSFNRREYRRLADVSEVLNTLTSGSNNLGDISIRNSLRIRLFSLDITNVDYQDGYYPLPYLTNHSDTFNAIQNPYLKEEFTIANYETASCNVPFLVRLYDAYMHEMGYMGSASDTPQNLANAFYDDLYYNSELGTYPQNNGRLIPALLFKYYGESSRTDEDEAYAQILKEYLNVPDSVKKLRTFMKDVKVDGVEDAIIYVREALDNLAEYSLTPGKISGNADFV